MRFVSQFPGFGAQIRVQRQKSLGDMGVEVLQEGLYVQFTPVHAGGMLYDNERRTALDHFQFRGNTQDIGEAVPTDPINRLSVLDTDEAALQFGWTDEEKQLVEERLTQLARTSPEEVLVVSDTPIAKPYPAYDEDERDPEQLVVKLIEDGHDLDRVLDYERIFGPKRPEVIEMLEQAIEMRKELVVEA